ncbi:sugar transferase, partial [Microvirga sp. 3-52]|nr:sugar transferase [Microvirga sp. 3-52]
MAKRTFDIIFSVFIIIAISPILLLISLLVKLEDGGPVIFQQQRAGQNGKTFNIYKFRTMKVQQEQKEPNESKYNWPTRVPDDFVFKMTDDFDPNVTKIGRFLRKSSLDELPQFFNVVTGEMSIVGPRPEIIEITNCYDAEQFHR